MIKANVFNIQRFCVNDGPGIRTTVFLKGCGLDCAWCHNPESKCFERELMYADDLCIFCKGCEDVCENEVHIFENEVHKLVRENCTLCGKCERECPSEALEIAGKQMTVTEVFAEVMKDKAFYDNSGGGITVSGGEPLHQFEFTYELLKLAKQNGIHTCMETSGYADSDKILEIAEVTDLFLYDFKITDSTLHKKYTGVDNSKIKENLFVLDQNGKSIILRCPVIPEVNDTKEHFDGIAGVANSLKNIEEINIMPYHSIGISKYQRLGRSYEHTFGTPDAENIKPWIDYISGKTDISVKQG